MTATRATLLSELQSTGIRRVGSPSRGFRYRRADGEAVSRAARERIARLRVPPAWRDVAIAKRPSARVQAVGRDARGRWQYLYHPEHAARRARRKYDRLVAFAHALPALRASLRRDLARRGMPLERACAAAVMLMSVAALRSGTDRYARTNGSFGLTTLRPRHVDMRGDKVRLSYRGKHGVPQAHVLRVARLARLLREMLRLPGSELFKYVDARGRVRDLSHEHVNAYVKHAMGARFTAKDFRTWSATMVCAGALARRARRRAAGDREAVIREAIAETAQWLGSTPKVARAAYVHPAVVGAAREGRVVARTLQRPALLAERIPARLHPAERALVRLIDGG